jgi:hypothetical protein
MATNASKILFINKAGQSSLVTNCEFFDGTDDELKKFVLDTLNLLGKSAHALIKRGDKFFVVDHTARKGLSKVYWEHETKYHPYMKELV